jgi:ATP-dependent Clp protease protease subunit
MNQQKSWMVAVRDTGKDTLEISVYDQIGGGIYGDGISAKDLLTKLRSAPKATKISLRVNSVGGVVDEAKAMHSLLRERVAAGVEVEATVDGLAASAASYLLTAASKVLMASNAFQMVHQVRGGVRGTSDDLGRASELFKRTNAQLAQGYADASARRGKGKTQADFLAEFARGDRYLDADEAIEWGLADAKVEPMQMVATLADVTLLSSAPEALRSAPYVTGQATVVRLGTMVAQVHAQQAARRAPTTTAERSQYFAEAEARCEAQLRASADAYCGVDDASR